MSFLQYWWVECKRLWQSRITWIVLAITLCLPLAGFSFYEGAYNLTRASQLLANPTLATALGGAILFALLTLFEQDRVHKQRMDALTDTIVAPQRLDLARLCALLLTGLLTGLLMSLLYLPYTALKMGDIFSLSNYFGAYLLIAMPGLWLGSLFATVFYQITRRVELSFILFAACAFVNLSGLVIDNYLLRWLNPAVWVFSDSFSNTTVLRAVFYSRLVWLTLLCGLLCLSLLCVRRYGRGLLGSLARNARKVGLPIAAVLLLLGCGWLYENEPIYDKSVDYESYYATELAEPDALLLLNSQYVEIKPNTRLGTMQGRASYLLDNAHDAPTELIFNINSGYTIQSLQINGVETPFANLDTEPQRYRNQQVSCQLPPEGRIELTIAYSGYPQMWAVGGSKAWFGDNEICNDYIYLLGGAFAPVLVTPQGLPLLEAEITLPAHLTPIIFGDVEVIRLRDNDDGSITWYAQEEHVMMYLYAADYNVRTVDVDDLNVEFYYSAKHERMMAEHDVTATLAQVIEYCQRKIGPLSFYGESGVLKLVQMTAFMGGGYAGNGMSVMDETAFSEDGLNDPWRGASGAEVMAHEIIHQWWGLGAMFDDDYIGEWSSEGFTVYTTYRLMKERYGADYAQANYVDVWQQAVDDHDRNFYTRHPEYLETLPENYGLLIQESARSVNSYCRMPLKILKAAALVGGEERMDEILAGLFQNQEDWINWPMLSYQDFLNACGLTMEDIAL